MSAKRTVMAHMIPYYPSIDASRRVAAALIDGGAAYLELQFPYSDPTADGPAIQGACATALDAGFRVAEGWTFVEELVRGGAPPIFLMSYAGLVYAQGVERFVEKAAEVGVTGLIIPDLPLDSDEGLFAAGRRTGVQVVPVISMGAPEGRIALVEGAGATYIYATLRRGITGSKTEIGRENSAFIQRLSDSGARVLAGFGIATGDQVEAVVRHAHAAVVGSAFVREIAASPADPYPGVLALARHLTGMS
jgi:tryptophan synthase alpha chain